MKHDKRGQRVKKNKKLILDITIHKILLVLFDNLVNKINSSYYDQISVLNDRKTVQLSRKMKTFVIKNTFAVCFSKFIM